MKKKTNKISFSKIVLSVLAASKKDTIAKPIRQAIDSVHKYIDSPLMLKELERIESPFSTTQKRVRYKLAHVLIAMFSYMDFASFRIGVAKKEHLSPVMHRFIISRYKAITGEEIKRSTYFRMLDKLISAGYVCTEAMNIAENDENGDRKIRGKAGYKWLCSKIFFDLGFTKEDIEEDRSYAKSSLIHKKLSNAWPTWTSKTAIVAALKRAKKEAFSTHSNVGQFDTDDQLSLYH